MHTVQSFSLGKRAAGLDIDQLFHPDSHTESPCSNPPRTHYSLR